MNLFKVLMIASILSTGLIANTIVTIGDYPVSANSTFLEQSSSDNCGSPMAVNGCTANVFDPLIIPVTAGETLILTEEGGPICFIGGTSGCVLLPLGGVFDSSNTDLLSSSHQNRLPNEVSFGLPNIEDPNFNAYYGDLNTQIPDDFYICGTVIMPDCSSVDGTIVTVPSGANYLYVAVLDSFYADNVGNVSVLVQEVLPNNATPEPASWLLVGIGLLFLFTKIVKYES